MWKKRLLLFLLFTCFTIFCVWVGLEFVKLYLGEAAVYWSRVVKMNYIAITASSLFFAGAMLSFIRDKLSISTLEFILLTIFGAGLASTLFIFKGITGCGGLNEVISVASKSLIFGIASFYLGYCVFSLLLRIFSRQWIIFVIALVLWQSVILYSANNMAEKAQYYSDRALKEPGTTTAC